MVVVSARRVWQLVSVLCVFGLLVGAQARGSSGMLVTHVRGQSGGVLGDAALAVPPAEGGAAAGLSSGAADDGAKRLSRRQGLQPLLKLSAAGKAKG